jgi:hypothetical protein
VPKGKNPEPARPSNVPDVDRAFEARLHDAEQGVPRPPLLPLHRDDLLVRINTLATHVALFARQEGNDRTNLARAAKVLVAVAQELRFGGTESRVIKTMFRAARGVLPKPERGEVYLWDVETGPHDTSARDELRGKCQALAATFTKAWAQHAALPRGEQRDKLRAMFTTAVLNMWPFLVLRMPSSLRPDEPDSVFAQRVGDRLADIAEENASKDRLRYRDEARPPRVSGEEILRAIVGESRLSMRTDFNFVEKPSKKRRR